MKGENCALRKSKTFYNIFIPVLLLSVGIVIGFGSYIYISTTNSVVDRVGDGQQSLITQIRNTLEQKIQTIEYAFATYSTTPSFRSVIDSPMTEQEFEAYRELKSQLGYIATMGLEGVQYTLVSLQQKWSLSNGTVSRMTSEETELLQNQFADQEGSGLYWTKTSDGIRLLQGLPVHSKKKQAVALSDISLQTLNRSLLVKPNTSIYILNKQGEPLYTTKSDQEHLSNQQMKLISERTVKQAQTGQLELPGSSGDKIIALYARSDYNGWTYVTLLDAKEVSGALTPIRIGLIVMGIVIMALMVIIAYILSVYLTKPFRKIQKRLADTSKPMVKDEVDWIIQSIDSIVSEKKDLEQLIQLEKPKLEAQFVLNLLQNRLTREEVEKNLERFGYDIDSSTVFITMLIQVDRCGEGSWSDKDVLLLTVNQLVQEIIPATERMLPVVLNERTQATLLFCSTDKVAEIQNLIAKYAKNIILSSRDYWNASVSVGVSAPYEDLLQSREACSMSLEALYQRLKLGKESVIFYEDISRGSSGPMLLRYPKELESQLFDAIRLGDKDEATRTLYPLLADMMKHSQNPMNLEIILIRFVNNLIHLEQLIGAEVLLTQSNATLYQRLLNTLNPEEIEHILVHEVIYPMVVSMQEKANHQFRSVADQIASIVRTEYDQELSLESISERLHYTPNYLSSIFRKEYGMTFSDYLMGFRLDVARKWLIDTDMPIKDIAERLGYQNSQNFIRSFRKQEHVTPGAYRKMKLEL